MEIFIMNYPDPAELKDRELAIAYEYSIPTEEPASEPPPSVCGQCTYHRSNPWDYCSLRAAADIHPCNLSASSSYAERCPFFELDCPF
jgi:hypothetical protein